MIVDTSAIISVLKGEAGMEACVQALADCESARISAASYLEAGIVIDRVGDPVLSRHLDRLLEEIDVSVEPVTAQQAEIARRAYRDFGKGSGHPAGLNFGDCFTYALASESNEPLLFRGDDFSQTDIVAAI